MPPRGDIDPKLVEEIVADLKKAFALSEPAPPSQPAAHPTHPPKPPAAKTPTIPPKHPAPKTPTIPPKHPSPKTPTVPPKHPSPKAPTVPPKHPSPKTPTVPPKHPSPKTPTVPTKHGHAIDPPHPAEHAQPLLSHITPAFPPEVPLTDGRPEDVRKIAVFYTAQFAVPIGVVVGYLQDVGRKIGTNPLMVTKVLVERVVPATNPRIAAGKAKTAKAVAVIAILDDLPPGTIKIWNIAMDAERLNFHLLTPEQAADRSVLIDIMSGLLLLDPNTPEDDYKWDNQGDKSGIRRHIR